MNKFLITLFIIWIVWKVIKSAIEELQSRMADQSPERAGKIEPRRPVPTPRRPAASREPESWEFDESASGEQGSELERWFGEAMERKRHIDKTDDAIPLPVTERTPPRPARPRTAQPRPAARRSEARVERRHEVRVERRQVVQQQEPVAVQPPPKRAERVPTTPRMARKATRRVARERRAITELAGIGKLDKNDIRRGIIIAELLGPPKGLRDIDSHVV